MNITRRLRGSSIPGAVLLVAGVLASYVFLSAQFALAFPASPQQAGAVPLSQGIADVAAQLAKSIPEGQTMTVAVTDFPDLSGQSCRLGRYAAERLSTLLSQHSQCHLIERRRLDMVLQELKFSMSELVDPAKARKLGQMLGVQGLVVGTVSNVESTLDLDARIIDIQTDVSLPGATASIVKDEAINKMASDCAPAVGPPIGPQPPPPSVKPVVAEGITFDVKSCEVSGATVTCHLTVTNGGREDQSVAIMHSSRMIDDSGNEYRSRSGRFGNTELWHSFGFAPNTLVSGVATNLTVAFEEVSAGATRISLLEIGCSDRDPRTGKGRDFVVQVRGIPLTR